jgi:hypothetical protein
MASFKKRTYPENTIYIGQAADPYHTWAKPVDTFLILSHDLVLSHHLKVASSDLELTQEVTTNQIEWEYVSDTLTLSDNVTKTSGLYESLEDVLNLTQEAKNSIHAGLATSTLSLTQTVGAGGGEQPGVQPINKLVVTDLVLSSIPASDWAEWYAIDPTDADAIEEFLSQYGLQHEVSIQLTLNIAVTSPLNFEQETADAIWLDASDHIHFTQSAESVLYESVISNLTLTQSISNDVAYPVSNTLELSQVADPDNIQILSASNALSFTSVCSFVIVDFCNYSPGVGEGSFGTTPPSMTDPTLVRRSSTRFTYPYAAPTTTIDIRNPNFGNSEQFEFRRINRVSRGGTLQMYRDSAWPQAERLIMTFSALEQADVKSILAFLNQSLGKEIGILDFESRQWRGVLLTPASPGKQDGIERFSITLEFEGELV